MTVVERIAALPPEQQAVLLRRLDERRALRSVEPAWVVRPSPNPDAQLRLFCFAYAGGGPSTFRTWADGLPAQVEVCAVQLPGRESRIGEPAYRRLGPLVAELADAITPDLDRPFAFFGHSMGALVAFELARELRRSARPQPTRLSLAAFRAPQLPNPNIRIHHLPDEVFKVVLRSEGVPETVLQSDELMQAMLPTLRADFEVCDAYEYVEQPPLSCPLSIFGGLDDVRVPAASLEGWRVHTGATSSLALLPGSHFFVHTAADALLDAITRDVRTDIARTNEERHV